MNRTLATTLLASTVTLAPVPAGADPELVAVDVGVSGATRYVWEAVPEGDVVRLTVPETDASDVLASLVVVSGADGTVGLTTATPPTAIESLRGGRFPSVPRSVEATVEALEGLEVTLETGSATVTGEVMGTHERTVVEDGVEVRVPVVLLATASGLREVVLEPGTTVTLPPLVRRELDAALEAEAQDAGTRTFDLALDGAGPTVRFGYVTSGPAWKNAWRLSLPDGRLEGWATLENVSGADWSDVRLTLVTGEPVAYARDLLAPSRRPRPNAPDLVGEAPTPDVDPGFAAPTIAARGIATMDAAPTAFAESAKVGAVRPAETATIRPSVAAARYLVPSPVDLPAGRTVSIPYLDVPVAVRPVALYRSTASRDGVVLAARLSAEVPLPAGVVSVRDGDGFVGDAPFAGAPAGEERLLPYAGSDAVVTSDASVTSRTVSLVSLGGAIGVRDVVRTTSTFSAAGLDGAEEFVVDHPIPPGSIPVDADDVERSVRDGTTVLRLVSPVTDGTATVSSTVERASTSSFGAGPASLADAVRSVRIGPADTPSEDFLRAARLVARATRTDREIARLRGDREAAAADQARLRANLSASSDVDLRRLWTDRIREAQRRLDDLAVEVEGASRRREGIEAEIAALAETLTAPSDPPR